MPLSGTRKQFEPVFTMLKRRSTGLSSLYDHGNEAPHVSTDQTPPESSVNKRRKSRSHLDYWQGPVPTSQDSQHPSATIEALLSLSKKVTACDSCRKQKIKCDMPNEQPPCTRCDRRGLPCIMQNNLQALLNNANQTNALRADVSNLHRVLRAVCQQLNLGLPPSLESATSNNGITSLEKEASSPDKDQDGNACDVSPPSSPSAVQAPMDTFLSPTSADTPHGIRAKLGTQHQDLISKGILTTATAQGLVDRYFARLDHYLYGIASHLKDMGSVRRASPILFTAICTVSALHDSENQNMFDVCNKEFRRLVACSLFEKWDLEYVRALCIASFWLSDASRIFCADAIRRAADMRLHKCFQQATGPIGNNDGDGGKERSTDKVRLWYLLFVCDQHLSVLHNRDALLRGDSDIAVNWELYLQREGSQDSDVRIMSQVSLLLIMSQMRDVLGSHQEEQLPQALTHQLNSFTCQIDKWFTKFSALFKPNEYIGDFPRRGLETHYQFGRLYLGHHVFKGLKSGPIPTYFLPTAHMAHDAATSIFEMLSNDSQFHHALVGIPHYFHIMIAFAHHFLLEVCFPHSEQMGFSVKTDLESIGRVLGLFQGIQCSSQHPISRMTPGLIRKYKDYKTTRMSNTGANTSPTNESQTNPPRSLHTNHLEVTCNPVQVSPTAPNDSEFSLDTISALNDFPSVDFEEFNFSDMNFDFMALG